MTRIASTPRILRGSFSPNLMAFRSAASPPSATARGFDFLGLYIVKAEHRGQGFGLELWRAALDHLGDRVIGLDGVVAQQDNYRKSGFRLAFRNIRQKGRGGGAAPPGLTELAAIPIEEILRYDETAFPARAQNSSSPGSGSRKLSRLASSTGEG